MKNFRKVLTSIIVSASFVLIGAVGTLSAEEVVCIINKSNPTLTKSQIKKIFRASTNRLPNGKKIKVLLNKNSSVYKAFCKKYMRMSVNSVNNKWVKKNIRDGVPVPRKVPSSVVLMMVKNSKGFIGFVEKSKAKGVKILE